MPSNHSLFRNFPKYYVPGIGQSMLIQPLPCVTLFVEALNESLRAVDPMARLTFTQRTWLGLIC
jgi:hypothetical protein